LAPSRAGRIARGSKAPISSNSPLADETGSNCHQSAIDEARHIFIPSCPAKSRAVIFNQHGSLEYPPP
jgi:hypothetical protein